MMVLQELINIGMVLVVAIIVHELGHWVWYYKNKGIAFNIQWYYNSLSDCGFKSVWDVHLTLDERMNSLLMGIVPGLFVVGMVILTTSKLYLSFTLPLYMLGCKDDLYKLIDVIKEQGDLSEFSFKIKK